MSDDHVSIDKLLEVGREAILEIAASGISQFTDPLVCFHFFCPEDEHHDRWGGDAECVRISKPLFEAMPFEIAVDEIGGCVGIEAWEKVRPTEAWLIDRLPRMLEIARASKMEFVGWSFEPKGGPIISAGVNVVSANSPDGIAAIEGLIESVKATKH